MQNIAIISLILVSLHFLGCDQITTESSDEPINKAPIVQLADSLYGNEGQSLNFHIMDFFDSEVPLVNSELFSDHIQIIPIEKDSFLLAHPEDSSGHFSIIAQLINEDEFERFELGI